MLSYSLKRIIQMVPTVAGVVLLTFVLFNVVPNDLAAIALGKNVTADMLEAFDEQRGLNRPLFFGTRAKTRAYVDHDFKEGAGRWRGEGVKYDPAGGVVRLQAGMRFQPLAFVLDDALRFEWLAEYRGEGIVGGKAVASDAWQRARIRADGAACGMFEAGTADLEIRRLRLRRIQGNPFDSQLLYYLKQLARGDLGRSETFKQPVAGLLVDGIGPSLSLTVPIFIIGIIVSISLALICAYFRNRFVDRFLVVIAVALMSINYLVYIVAGQHLLAYKLGAFPVWGYESARYLVLPVLIGVASGLGSNLRFYRTVMLDEMYKDYVRTAFAKGVSRPRVLFVHVLKNALIPIITNVVIAIPFLYTGSLLLENFFGIPGLGYLGVNAILASDVDVVRALVLIGALLFVAANLLTDICYAAADPRVKLK